MAGSAAFANLPSDAATFGKDFLLITPNFNRIGKGSKMECKNYRGISLLDVPGKVYGRIIIQRIINVTGLIGEEQCSFR